jgi:hypothetical protein
MKNLKTKSYFLAGLFVLLGCEKNDESFKQEASVHVQEAATIPPTKVQVENNFGKYFEALDTVCAPYLRYTTKMDISKVPNEWFISTLEDQNMKMTFYIGGETLPRKYNPTMTQWWYNWNVSPYVEETDPHVMIIEGWGSTTITLSKKCYIFGFELSALLNMYNNDPVYFGTSYRDTDQLLDDTPIGRIHQEVKSPEGARLFAVKSEIPFNQVTIYWTGGSNTFTQAYAITNLRYVTSKKVFDQHNN